MKSNINDELTECYDRLGLTPGASPEELKEAYRDLAKVWHPDRFLHDPRLRAKAQEKLKEINEAYDRFRSRDKPTQPHDSTRPRHTSPAPERSARHAGGHRIARLLVLGSVLTFAVVFLVTSRSLEREGERENQSQIPAIEQVQDPPYPEGQQVEGRGNVSANELHSNDRIKAKSQRAESGNASATHASGGAMRPLPTVTIVIDPYTHMIATASCPIKTTMTYPRGNEPRQYCAWHPEPTPTPAWTLPKDARLKSAARHPVSPGKWLGGAKSDGGNEEDSNSP